MNTTPTRQRRSRRSKIQAETRQAVVFKYNQGLSVPQISREVSLPRLTVNEIIKLFTREGRILPKKRGGNRRTILSLEDKSYIRELVDANPALTLKDIIEKISRERQVTVDVNTVDRCLKDFHYTLKQLVLVPLRRNTLETIKKRFLYAEEFSQLLCEVEDKNLIFIDEVGFSVVSRTKRGRSLSGTAPILITPATRSINISVLAAAHKYGMLDCHINDTPVTGEDFKRYILNLKVKAAELGLNTPVFILDNARIHHYSGLRDVLVSEGIVLKYLPPYSPMLNIIENCFSKWKNHVLRSNATSEAMLRGLITAGMEIITADDCDGFFRKMLRAIEISRRREPFNE